MGDVVGGSAVSEPLSQEFLNSVVLSAWDFVSTLREESDDYDAFMARLQAFNANLQVVADSLRTTEPTDTNDQEEQ
jgi:hypothetical protein